ncbi:hypothetical protein B484DRAFT_451869 [Ochromonadaceae sp. CCMP2298]|nr:hypothetical protein B484DRAFT_451869 [Ochromonadaceae sp. CCMP2298]
MSLKLYYFDIAGKGEAIRLACAYGNLPLDDIRLDRDGFDALKTSGKLSFGQLPALQVGEEMLFQSAAIIKYVGKQCGLYPRGGDDMLAARIDALLDCEADLFAGLSASRYAARYGFGFLTPADQAACRAELNTSVLPRHLSNLELQLANSQTGWIANTPLPSVADFALVPRLQWLVEPGVNEGISPTLLEGYPLICALIEKLMALPQVVAYYAK